MHPNGMHCSCSAVSHVAVVLLIFASQVGTSPLRSWTGTVDSCTQPNQELDDTSQMTSKYVMFPINLVVVALRSIDMRLKRTSSCAAPALLATPSEWPYPQLPWTFAPIENWFFYGSHPLPGNPPPDSVPDPSIKWARDDSPTSFSYFTITRYRDSFWGPYDELLVSPNAVLNAPLPVNRITFGYSSAIPPILPSFPIHTPHALARFAWTEIAGGSKNLDVFSPPNSSAPIFSIRGLYGLTFPSFPFDFNTFSSLGVNFRQAQSVVDSYNPLGNITGHVLTDLKFKGLGSIAVYSSVSYSPPVNLDGGFYNVGVYTFNASVLFTAKAY